MGKTVDDRVVAMSFENAKFEANAAQTISTLDRLKQSLHLGGASKGLQDVAVASDKLKSGMRFDGAVKSLDGINAATRRVSFNPLNQGLETVKASFSALEVVGVTALATIASKVVTTATDMVKSLSVAPIMQGFSEYTTNLNSIQTILANTEQSGATLADVNKALDELNRYSDKTIYNFSEMANAIGLFTAAGVDLDTSVQSIKGIANLAALSGSNAQKATGAYRQLAQAIAVGKVTAQDWMSVTAAGLSGTQFQRALAQTGEAMGTLEKGSVKLKGAMKNVTVEGKSFRESILSASGPSWLTSDVLTTTLKQFTGDMTDAELAAIGFNDAQIHSIQKTAKIAQIAATNVKDLGTVFKVAAETSASGWGDTFEIIFGGFNEAKKTFTALSNGLNGIINRSAESRNAVLKDWKDLGGRTKLIESFKNIFAAVGAVVKTVSSAFRAFFPAKTGQELFDLTKRFEAFTASLIPGKERLAVLKRIFAGVFAIFSIGASIVTEIFGVFKKLFGIAGEGSGGFLELIASIADFIVQIAIAIRWSEDFGEVFDKLGDILAKPILLFGKLASAIGGLFSGGGSGGGGGSSATITILDGLAKAAQFVIDVFGKLGDAIGEAFGNVEFNDVIDAITVGLLGGILLAVKNFIKEFKVDISGGLLGEISGSFNQLTGTLKTMQRGIQADTLMKIAIAVGILALSVVALSKIDGESLSKSLSALGVAFGMLLVAMGIIAKISATGGFIKVPLLAASMILLAVAIDALVIAVFALSKLSWEELAKGLTGVAVLLAAISAASIPLSANSGGMVRAGIGILAISIALKVLASAVKDFGTMDWGTIGKGLVGVAGALVAVGLAMMFVPPNIALTGIGLIAVAVGLKGLAAAIKTFGGMDLAATGKGLGIIVAAIVALGIAVSFLPKTLALQAAGLVLLSVALGGIAASIALMGQLSLGSLAKGLAALAGAMAILAIGLNAMRGTLTGSASLVIAAAALALLVPPMLLLGQQSWGSIVKGLVSLAGAFVVLGVAGVFIGPLAPAILALGASLVVAGAGMLLFGAGVALLGTGLASLVIVGPAAIGILVKMFIELAKIMPKVALELGKAIVVLIQTVAAAAPQIAVAVGQLITAMLNAIIINAPKIGQAFLVLLTTAVNTIRVAFPMLVNAGLQMLASLLQGLAQNIGRITTAAANVIINFITALTAKLPELVTAGAKFLIKLLEGIGKNIGKIAAKATEVIAKFVKGVASKLGDVLDAGADVIKELIEGLGKGLGGIATKAGEALGKFVTGIGKGLNKLITAGTDMLIALIAGIGNNSAKLVVAAMDTLLKFLWAIQDAITVYAPQITTACGAIGIAIVAGVAQGLAGLAKMLVDKLISPVEAGVAKVKNAIKSKSPSKVFIEIGKAIGDGFSIGLTVSGRKTVAVMEGLAKNVIAAFSKTFKIAGPLAQIQQTLTDFISDGLVNGLKGSIEDIDSAFLELNKTLVDNMTQLKEDVKGFKDEIKSLQESRAEYRNQKDKDKTKKERAEYKAQGKAIDDLKDKISSYNKEFAKLSAGRSKVTATVNPEVAALKALQTEYTRVTTDIEAAQSAYDSLKSSRDSFVSGVVDKFSTLPGINSDKKGKELSTYIKDLTTLTTDTEAYGTLLNQLRGMGLDDATYKMLLDQGVAGKKFAEQLLAAGPGQIAALTALDGRIQTAARSMGDAAALAMYDAGVATAKGLLDGLKADQEGLLKAIGEMADAIIDKMKKKLKIKSPSRVFNEIGKFTAEGLVVGLKSQTGNVTAMAERLGTGLSEALATSLASTVDFDPVIKPVLDLSDIQNSAKRLGDLGAVSYGYATDISAAQMKSLEEAAQIAAAPQEIKFEQNNYSPEALTAAEIYRQTNNQLSRAKALASV